MARKTKEEAQETKDRILNAAIDVFYEHGVSKSSLEEIAEAAGVTRGAVYWHFKNKTDIFSALHDRFHTSAMEAFLDSKEKSSALDHLRDFSINFLGRLKKEPREHKILSLFSTKCDYSGEMAVLLENQFSKKSESLDAITDFFKKAIDENLISAKNDPRLLAISYFCYICGICDTYMRHPDLFDLDALAKSLIDLFFKGLAK